MGPRKEAACCSKLRLSLADDQGLGLKKAFWLTFAESFLLGLVDSFWLGTVESFCLCLAVSFRPVADEVHESSLSCEFRLGYIQLHKQCCSLGYEDRQEKWQKCKEKLIQSTSESCNMVLIVNAFFSFIINAFSATATFFFPGERCAIQLQLYAINDKIQRF